MVPASHPALHLWTLSPALDTLPLAFASQERLPDAPLFSEESPAALCSPSQGTEAFISYYSRALELEAAPLDSVPKNLLGEGQTHLKIRLWAPEISLSP